LSVPNAVARHDPFDKVRSCRCLHIGRRTEDLNERRPCPRHRKRNPDGDDGHVGNERGPPDLGAEHLEVERGGQHEPEHDADAAPDEREEVGEVGHEHRQEPDDHDEDPAQPPGVALAAEQALGDLVHRVHHHGHGEEEVDAEAELHQDGEPPRAEVGGDDVPRGCAEREVAHDAEQAVHDGDERHGQRERGAEPALVRGLRLQRQDHADSLEGVDGDAEPVEDLGGAGEGEHGGLVGEPDGSVLAQDDAHGAEVDDVGEDAEWREERERLDGVEAELERQHGPDEERLGGEERRGRGVGPDRVEVRHGVGDEDEVADAEAGLAEHEHGVDGVAAGRAVDGVAQVPEGGDLGVLVGDPAARGDEQHHTVEGERGDGEEQQRPRRPARAGEGVGEAQHARADHRDEDVGERLGLRRQVPARAAVLREQRRRRVEPRGRGARLLVESHGHRPLDRTDRAAAGWRERGVAAWPAGVRGNGELGELAPCAFSLCSGGAAGPVTASGRGGWGIGRRSRTRRGLFLGRRRGHGSRTGLLSNQSGYGVPYSHCPCGGAREARVSAHARACLCSGGEDPVPCSPAGRCGREERNGGLVQVARHGRECPASSFEASPRYWVLANFLNLFSAVRTAPSARVGNQATVEQICRKINVPRPNLSGQVPSMASTVRRREGGSERRIRKDQTSPSLLLRNTRVSSRAHANCCEPA
jgi:hypothetical protein